MGTIAERHKLAHQYDALIQAESNGSKGLKRHYKNEPRTKPADKGAAPTKRTTPMKDKKSNDDRDEGLGMGSILVILLFIAAMICGCGILAWDVMSSPLWKSLFG